MNLKPFRDYDEHDVVNGYFSLDTATGSKGTFVKVSTFNPDSWQEFAGGAGSYARSINGVFSSRVHTTAKVVACASGEQSVLGMLLYDVKEDDENGFPLLISNADKSKQLQCVNSGQPVPIATRGTFEVNGFVGTPAPMSGFQIADAGGGAIKVVGKDVTPRLGYFLSQTGADGYAIIRLTL